MQPGRAAGARTGSDYYNRYIVVNCTLCTLYYNGL
jgi:hypothetical protein